MEKEKVLEFEIINNDEFGIVGRLRQNTELLKRGEKTKFSKSFIYPYWDIIEKELYTYGSHEEYDNLIFTVPKDDIDLFLDKVNNINEKYGKPKRWRAKFNEFYFFIKKFGNVGCYKEDGDEFDNNLYNFGNYFQTKEEAQLYADKIKKILSERE